MTNVVQAKEVEDQNVPVVSFEGAFQVTGHIVVNLDGSGCIWDARLVMYRISSGKQNCSMNEEWSVIYPKLSRVIGWLSLGKHILADIYLLPTF